MGNFRKAMTFDTSFLGIKTFSNKVFFVIILLDSFSQHVQREATNTACIARADNFVYEVPSVKTTRIKDASRSTWKKAAAIHYSVGNLRTIFTHDYLWSLLFSSVYRIGISKFRKHKKTWVFWGNSLGQFRKRRCDVTRQTRGRYENNILPTEQVRWINQCVLSGE